MRIAHVTQATASGGLRRVLETLARGQRVRNEVRVLAPTAPKDPGLGQDWRPLELTGNLDVRGHHRLLRLLRAWAPDVVFLHAGSPGEMALASAVAGTRAACVVVEHSEYFPRSRTWLIPAYRFLKRRGTAWVSVSVAGARHLEEAWRILPGSLRVVWNGVDPPAADPPPAELQSRLGDRPLVVGFGRPNVRKGFDRFVHTAGRLAKEFPALRWVWAGGEAPNLAGEVQVWPWIVGPGWLMDRATCVVIPSRQEGLPLILLEAWAVGACVVSSAVGGIPEVLKHGENGLLVTADDNGGWERNVAAVLRAPEFRSRLGMGGRRTWEAHFTAERMVARYEALLAELVP